MMAKRSNGVTLCAHLIVSRTPVPCTRSGADTAAVATVFVVSAVAVPVGAVVAAALSMRAVFSNSTEPHQPGLSVEGSTRVGASRNRSCSVTQQQYSHAPPHNNISISTKLIGTLSSSTLHSD
jgi:hypothetical protein